MVDIFNPLSVAANSLRRQAMDLAGMVRKGRALNRIIEIFIIRARRPRSDAIATVIEVPAYLVGGYGGQDGPTDFYTPFVIADMGPVIGAVTSRKIRLNDLNNPIPNVSMDKYKGRAFEGGGRVVIGDVPAWEAFRQALNSTTGVYTACRSAITIAVCPSLSEETSGNRPWVRSLTICRVCGETGPGAVSTISNGVATLYQPLDILPGHVMMTPTPPAGGAARISGFEIAQTELGIGGTYELLFAGAAIEWGALRGLVAVQYRTLTESNNLIGNGIVFVSHNTVDNGQDAPVRYTGAVTNAAILDASTVPSIDAPTDLAEVAAADPSFTYPSWSINTTVSGRDARSGQMVMRDLNLYARLFSASMGNVVDGAQSAMTLVEIQSDVDAPDVSVRGYRTGPPLAFNTVVVPAVAAKRWVTYVAELSAGVITLVKLAEFLDSRYEPGGPLLRKQIQTFGGCTTLPTEIDPYGEPRLFCTEWSIRYEVKAAEPDGPAPNLIQGEPERRVQQAGNQYVRLTDMSFYLLSASGVKTHLALGAYFPALFAINTSAAGIDPETIGGRLNFGNSGLRTGTQRIGSDFPLIHCQFAPGIIAVIVAPVSGYTSGTQILRIALFSVATGAMLVLSPALLGVALPARMSMSCFEQGTVDEDGNLLTYGRLVIGVSTTSALPTRNDGWFVVTGLRSLTWLAREPSNTAPHYVGNSMVPADIGETANLTFTKPTLD